MKSLYFFIVICLTIASCDNHKKIDKENFKSFDFSYNDVFSTCFSIKFNHSDTVYVRQHFASTLSDKLKNNTTYFAIITKLDREEIDSFFANIDFSKFDSSYYEPYQDGIEYQFYINKDSTNKIIYLHSDSVPKKLKSLGLWIANIKKNLDLHQIDTTISFGSTRNFLPPTVPEPPSKFTTPKVE